MDGGGDYAFFTHRVDSFKGRRVVVPTAKNPRAVKTFLWPHPDNWGPTPLTLAAAGFFFAPEPNSIDRVECFCCKRGLGSWEKTDNPFKEHYERAEDECAWAAARCSLEKDRKGKGKSISWRFVTDDRVPTNQTRYEARLQTFRDWPLDGIRGSTCTSKALARAGFVHTPEADNEDLTICFYCDRKLGGWKANDDPLEDHRRGDQSCPFLEAYDQAESGRKKRGPTRTVLSKTISRASLARHRTASSTYASEAELPGKRIARKGSRYFQSETDREATTATDATPPSKSRRGPGRPKKTAKSRIPSPVEAAEASGIDSYPTRPKRSKHTPGVSKTQMVADSESEAPVSRPKRGKNGPKAKPANSDDGVRPLASRRAPRTPAVESRQARSSGSSSDELLLPPSRRGTDLDTGSENEDVGRTPSRASSRAPSRAAASRMASKTPATSKGKKSRRTRASRAASSAVSDDEDSGSGAESSRSGTRGRARGSSRGRKTVTARDVAQQQPASLRRSSRTPGRSIFNERPAATESETDVNALLKAAAARAAARHASVSDAEGKTGSKEGSIAGSLSRSTRARAVPALASDMDEESDAVVTRAKPPFKVQQTAAIISRKASPNESRRPGNASTVQRLHNGLDPAELTSGAYLAASDSGADDVSESTPQPHKTSISAISASEHRSIPPPDFSGDMSISVSAPSERSAVNEWRELATQGKAQRAAAETIAAQLGAGVGDANTDVHGLPRIIAPLRKSKGHAFRPIHHSPKVKMEEDDSVIMISPPRPPRSPTRVPPGIDQTLSDKSNQGLGAVKSKTVIQNCLPSKLPTPKARTPQRAVNHVDTAADSMRAVRSPTTLSRPELRKALIAPAVTNPQQGFDDAHVEPQADPTPTPAPTVPQNTEENTPKLSMSAPGLQSEALDALRHVSPLVISNNGLIEDQLNSTLEEFIRAETQRKYSEIQAEGERLLRELQEEGARSRAAIMDHLHVSSQI